MVRSGARIWPVRLCLIAGCAVLPLLAGMWYTLIVLLLLPVIRVMLDAMRERVTLGICVAGSCLCAALQLPGWLWPVPAVWGLGLLGASALRVLPGKATIRFGAGLTAVAGITALALAASRYGGQLVPVLAQKAVDLVDRHPNGTIMLLSAYQSGLARLEGDLVLVPAASIFDSVTIPADVRAQLLYSLRASLEMVFQVSLPQWLVGWMLLTALVPALVLEGCLRNDGWHSDLPALGRWYLPGKMAVGAMILLLMGYLPYVTESPSWGYLGAMCGTLGYWAWAIQGASSAVSLMTVKGVQPLARGVLIALGVIVMPLILFLFGCYDQFRDPRQLRGFRNETI